MYIVKAGAFFVDGSAELTVEYRPGWFARRFGFKPFEYTVSSVDDHHEWWYYKGPDGSPRRCFSLIALWYQGIIREAERLDALEKKWSGSSPSSPQTQPPSSEAPTGQPESPPSGCSHGR